MLLNYGAQPNIQEYHEVGMATPLYRACEKNFLEVREQCDSRLRNCFYSSEQTLQFQTRMGSRRSTWLPDMDTSI